MDTVKVFCAGKINLSLNILGRNERLHYLDSIMQAVRIGDTVTAAPRLDNRLNIVFTGENFIKGSIGENNTVKKAADILRARFGGFGADIIVEKNLPIGGGLGGSSADAAGALVALNALFDFEKRGLDLFDAAKEAGSDVPFSMRNAYIIHGTTRQNDSLLGINEENSNFSGSGISGAQYSAARVGGTGDDIRPIKNRLDTRMVIAMAYNSSVNSGDAYRVFDGMYPEFKLLPSDNDKLEKALGEGDARAFSYMGNALIEPAQALCGEIKKTRVALECAGAFYTLMTGSGACVVGFFNSAEESSNALKELKRAGFWAALS